MVFGMPQLGVTKISQIAWYIEIRNTSYFCYILKFDVSFDAVTDVYIF